MKFTREVTNGIIIFLGIGIYFLALEFLGLSQYPALRIFNIIFVIYGVNRTIKGNKEAGVRGYNTNFLAAVITSMIGAILSVGALLAYIYAHGGESYIKNLSDSYIFGGGEISIWQYSIGLLFESVAASLMVSFCLMQYWKDKVEVINKVD
ncbi:hypothetical protein [Flavobacterium sp. 3HN19-14]|uniref:hypothetical protein n=1 Tax=Flavobacterium sp. 3HN19-14 TaxID=3448133 RepID=UPI003EE2FBC9